MSARRGVAMAVLGIVGAGWLATSGTPVAGQAPPCAAGGSSSLWADFVQAKLAGREPILPDFSYAGYRRSEAPIPTVAGPVFDVTSHGALPDDGVADDEGIQAAIHAAGAAGGGVVFFPAGRYLVSPSESSTTTLKITSSRVVLRGAGAGDGGSEIVMVSKRQGLSMINVFSPAWRATTVATVTACAGRETFWLAVDDTSRLAVGQWVILRHQSTEYSASYWGGLPLSPSWTRVYNSGTGVHEVHQLAEIAGSQVRFREPLHFNVVLGGTPWRLEAVNPLEEVGIEDLRLTGKWDEYPEAFVHHKDWIHDSGWTMLSFRQAVNSWVRRVEFRNLNQAIQTDTASFVTFEDIRYTGKKGHTSISHRRGYGVLVKDNEDAAAFHHGPGTGYNSVGVVYLRHRMQVGQQIDNHGGVPHATLLDQVTGGVMRGNGGPHDNYPHHGRYFVFWNFVHRSTGGYSYDFWDNVNRDSHTFALPIFAGFTANTPVTFQNESVEVGANESLGTPVTPGSLFEAQLQLRLCSALPPPPPPSPLPCPPAPSPLPTPSPAPSPSPSPSPSPGGGLGPNLALGKPASASTTWSSSYTASRAFDGGDSSRWSASRDSAADQWLAVDLLAATRYNCVQMKEISYKRVQEHVLQMSDDGVAYADIPDTAGTTIGALKTTCFETVASRHVRLFLKTSVSGGAPKEPTINEVGVYFQDRAPVLTVPDLVTAEAAGPDGASVAFTASAVDEVDGAVPVALDPPSGGRFPLGTTTVAATATDSAGNVARAAFDVIVEDTTPPALFLPAPIRVEATGPDGAAVAFAAAAADLVDGAVPVVFDVAPGSVFPLGTTTVTASATDAAGNTAVGDFAVAVVDTTPPALSVPPDVTVVGCERANIGRAAATDAVGTPVITSDAPFVFPLGTTLVTWRAVDPAGNAAAGVQRVTAVLGDDPNCCPAGTKVLVGTGGPDVLTGTEGRDCILGRGGDDVIHALGGDDFISGGAGRDTIAGGPGGDSVAGGPGDDVLDASLGDDVVRGGAGRDTIAAGPGSDDVDGGDDTDVCAVPPDGADLVRGCP